MSDLPEQISLSLAKDLLKSLYSLDQPINELSAICGELPDGELKKRLIAATGDLMFIVLTDLMVPIYRRQPTLGTASEPGDWFEKGAAR